MRFILGLLLSFSAFAYQANMSQIETIAQNQKGLCQLNKHCGKNNPLWSKYFAGIDLAEDVVKEVLKDYPLSKDNYPIVTVADSGFDFYNQHYFIDQGFNLEKLSSQTGNLYVDIDGHGTSVTGVISAKILGATKYTNLNILRLTKAFAEQRAKAKIIDDAIKKACQKSEIVNISWASEFFEKGKENLEELSWYQFAREQGCLVVKSSGNRGIQDRSTYISKDSSPLLTIGSLNSDGLISDFSTKAMIYAPGENIYSLVSFQKDLNHNELENLCSYNNIPITQYSGTSYAAPLVAASAAQVITILKARKILPINPAKKLKLLKNILLAAANYSIVYGVKDNNLNAYIAALISRYIEPSDFDSPMMFLYDSLNEIKGKECLKQINCSLENCNNKIQCLNKLRKQNFLCQSNQLESGTKIIKILKEMNEVQLYGAYIHKRIKFAETLSHDSRIAKEYKEKFLDDLWIKYFSDKSFILDAPNLLDIMRQGQNLGVYKYSTSENFIKIINKAVTFYFKIYDPENSTNDEINKNGKLFSDIYLNFSLHERENILSEFLNLYKKESLFQIQFNMLLQIYLVETNKNLKMQYEKLLMKTAIQSTINNTDESMTLENEYYEIILRKVSKSKILFKKQFSKGLEKLNTSFITFVLNNSQEILGRSKLKLSKIILNEIIKNNKQMHKSLLENKENFYFDLTKSLLGDIFKISLESDIIDIQLVKKLKEVMLLKLPIDLNIFYIFPEDLSKLTKNHELLIRDKKFLSLFINKQFEHLTYFINKEKRSYAYLLDSFSNNIFNLLTYRLEYLESLGPVDRQYYIDKLSKLLVISLSGLSTDKVKSIPESEINAQLKIEIYVDFYNSLVSKIIILDKVLFKKIASNEDYDRILDEYLNAIYLYNNNKIELSYQNFNSLRKHLSLNE